MASGSNYMGPPSQGAPGAHGPPGPGGPTGPAAALGDLPSRLLPGEHLIYFRPGVVSTVALWIAGILLLPILIGIIFIILALTAKNRSPRGVALTNRRMVIVRADGFPEEYWYEHFADVAVRRTQVRASGGGLLGAAVAAGAGAIADSIANNKPKHDPGYWARAAALLLIDPHGGRIEVTTLPAGSIADFGVKLVACISYRHADQIPPISVEDIERQYVVAAASARKKNMGCGIAAAVIAGLLVIGGAGFYLYEQDRRATNHAKYEEERRQRSELEEKSREQYAALAERGEAFVAQVKAGGDALGYAAGGEKPTNVLGAPQKEISLTHPEHGEMKVIVLDCGMAPPVQAYLTKYPVHRVGSKRVVALEGRDEAKVVEAAKKLDKAVGKKSSKTLASVKEAVTDLGWRLSTAYGENETALGNGVTLSTLTAYEDSESYEIAVLDYADAAQAKTGAAAKVVDDVVFIVTPVASDAAAPKKPPAPPRFGAKPKPDPAPAVTPGQAQALLDSILSKGSSKKSKKKKKKSKKKKKK